MTGVCGRRRTSYLAGALSSSLAPVVIEDIQAWHLGEIFEELKAFINSLLAGVQWFSPTDIIACLIK
jgi:hypothetical protein